MIRAQNHYDSDFGLWVADQVTALRLGNYEALDVTNVIEELEDLARRDRSQLQSRLATMMEHLIKLRLFPESPSIRGWNVTVTRSAARIARLFRSNPSLRTRLAECLPEAFGEARIILMKQYAALRPHDITDDDLEGYTFQVEAAIALFNPPSEKAPSPLA